MSDDLVVIFSGGSVKAGMIQSLLEADGLTAFLQDENMGMTHPWAISGGSEGAVKVMVPRSEAQEAREIIGAAGL